MNDKFLELILDILNRLSLEEREKDTIEKEVNFIKKYGIDRLPYHSINATSQPLPKETEQCFNIFEKKMNGMVIIRIWLIKKVLNDVNYNLP